MLIDYKLGTTSIILRVKLRNSSVTTGAGLTGLTSASTGLIISTIANNEATATAYTVAASNVETITTLGTYAAPTSGKVRFKEVDATNHPGVYEVQIANARFAVSNARALLVSIHGATNLVQADVLVPLRSVDPYDGVRFGLTALPNAAAGASGGLPTGDANGRVQVQQGTGTGQFSLAGGIIAADVVGVEGVGLATHTAGMFPADVLDWDAALGTDLTEIADAVLGRGSSNVDATAAVGSLYTLIRSLVTASLADNPGFLRIYTSVGGTHADIPVTSDPNAEAITELG